MARPRLVSQPTSDLIAAAVAALASLEQPHHASCARTWPAGNCGIRQDELGNLDQATRTGASVFPAVLVSGDQGAVLQVRAVGRDGRLAQAFLGLPGPERGIGIGP